MRRPVKKTPVTPRRAKSASIKRTRAPMSNMNHALKIGDKVWTVTKPSELASVHTIEHDADGIYIRCGHGKHYLDGRRADKKIKVVSGAEGACSHA